MKTAVDFDRFVAVVLDIEYGEQARFFELNINPVTQEIYYRAMRRNETKEFGEFGVAFEFYNRPRLIPCGPTRA